jgi:hypothetical protein
MIFFVCLLVVCVHQACRSISFYGSTTIHYRTLALNLWHTNLVIEHWMHQMMEKVGSFVIYVFFLHPVFMCFFSMLNILDVCQDISQPRSEANPPDGYLSVPLLRHQVHLAVHVL